MRRLATLIFALLPLSAAAFNSDGLSFSHHDWELACDNTGTCRAAGYSGYDAGDYAVSVLLTRPAGPGQAASGQAMIGQYGDNPVVDGLPAKFKLALHINGAAHGSLAFSKDSLTADLSASQLAALVAALAKHAEVEMSVGDHTWRLSDAGAAAVLLKMDEYQGRIGTPGALLRKGGKPEAGVPPAVPAPKFALARIPKPQPSDTKFVARHEKALRAALKAATSQEDCDDLHDQEDQVALEAQRLSPTQMLVSARCWMAAYNAGSGYWVVNDKPPFQPVLATTSGSDYSEGKIDEQHKGRGLGDCWSSRTLGWDGKRFQLIAESTTGMCRLIAPGGAWSLPTRVTR
ncbi:DUF1176 domain-containing protein [Pseudoduganella sp. DS3]|uniref:DUF1176 domain-containing protein n=1 Tax=Pseudoduganella guangdongensis TaxID=2692179 RepID=A0A6N9HD23_9BURK|nr:DUF1176 domain-containing protein [Pseudoduganella guangdongensis]MYN01461.1 DUF1176 domain-containing protein [Pseudoduganella guangdongensis]